MQNVLLTDDEIAILEEYRKEVAYKKVEEQFRTDVLEHAYKYRTWLKVNNKQMSYASFCERFGYLINDKHNVFVAVKDILSLVDSLELMEYSK